MTRTSGLRRSAAVAILAFVSPSTTNAQQFSHALPCSVTPGQKVRVTVYGKGLATAKHLWATFPATVEPAKDVKPTDTQAVFDVTADEAAPLGVHGWRVATASSISNLKLCVVDNLPPALPTVPSASVDQAPVLKLPCAVDAVMGNEQRGFFAVDVASGQRIAMEVVGDRLGTGFDPLLQLWTADGKEILSRDNDEGLGFDFRFDHVFGKAGRYYLEIRDTRYQGGGHWTYHLRVGDFPVNRVASPPSVQRGRPESIRFPASKSTGSAPPVELTVDDRTTDAMQLVSAPGADADSWVRVLVGDDKQSQELEPNNAAEHATVCSPPCALIGRLQEKSDVDYYRFRGQNGRQYYFRGDARRTGSPADLYLRLFDAAGKQVGVSDDRGAAEGDMTYTAPADGWYALAVEDLHRRGGPQFVYRVLVQSPRRDYSLALGSDRLVIPQGSAVPIAVTASRQGVGQAVTLTGRSSGSGLNVASTTLAGSRGAVVVKAESAPLGAQTLWIEGATAEPTPLRRAGDVSALLTPGLNNIDLTPTVRSALPVLVTPPAFFRLTSILKASYVGRYTKTKLQVHASRDEFFDGEIKLAAANLPPNVALAAKPIAKGAAQIELEFDSKAKTPLGSFDVFISGTATHEGRTATVFADVLRIDVRPAYSIKFTTEGVTVKRGQSVKVGVAVARHPGFNGPVTVALNKLPPGVSAKPITIDEKSSAGEIELTAAPEKPVTANVLATATAKVSGQNESAQSQNLRVVVQ